MGKFLYFFTISLFATVTFGQRWITIHDQESGELLIGATIACDGSGVITNELGQFDLEEVASCEQIRISYVGYESRTLDVSTLGSSLSLRQLNTQLEIMTVTGSRFERRMSESTVSVDVLKPELISNINATGSESIINKAPGVQIIGGQANIRGGSGFSYGAGSRVMVLIDDIPALQADAGYANWGDMPIENLGQIEIVKGAASTLYGSSALNGIINFRRALPTEKPQTKIFTSFTNYLDPANPKYKWWGDTLRYKANLGISHLQKFGKLSLSANAFLSKEESYARNTYTDHGRIGVNLSYNLKPNLIVGINSLVNYRNASDFFIWDNAISGIYRPTPGTISTGKRLRAMFDPFVKYFDDKGNSHKLLSRFFYTDNQNNNNQSNKSITSYGEYQYQKNISDLNLIITTGIVGAITGTEAELFADSTFKFKNLAPYLQLEYKAFDVLTLAAGLRYEYNQLDGPEEFQGDLIPDGKVSDGEWISRLGANLQLAEYSTLRTSWGQGYRYPTVTERYVSTTFSGFSIFPNPHLTPEYGWSAELGIKQGFRLASFVGFLDLSGFVSEYTDMIEFTFLNNPLGFKPINIGNTRITGYEASILGQVKVGPVPITLLSGYTYINPKYKNFEGNEELQASLSTNQNILKYRSKHSFKVDAQGDFYGFGAGISWQYYSHMINIDKRLEEPLDNVDLFEIKIFRALNNKGYSILDARLSYEFSKYKIIFLASNLKNKVYTVRPGLLEAPRNISVRLEATI